MKVTFLATRCPVTGGIATVMAREDFNRQCDAYQQARKKGAYKHLPAYEYCADICCGENIPKEITFRSINQMMKEREEMTQRKKGTCGLCGQLKSIKNCKGKLVCPTCEHIRRGVANNPEIVFALLEEFNISIPHQNESGIKLKLRAEEKLRSVAEETLKLTKMRTGEICEALNMAPDTAASDLVERIKCLVAAPATTISEPEARLKPNQYYIVPEGYEKLHSVLTDALDQAAHGKGKERHAIESIPFEQQKSCSITRRLGLGYALGQAEKKGEESLRLGLRGPRELLAAINYLAMGVIVMREELEKEQEPMFVKPFPSEEIGDMRCGCAAITG